MKNIYLFILLLPILTACTSSIAVMATGKDGEYVVVGRNMAGPFSSLELAQQEAVEKSTEACNKMGMSYKKLYSIDRPMAVGQVPESTLYFTCLVNNVDGSVVVGIDGSTTAGASSALSNIPTNVQREVASSTNEVGADRNEMAALISILEKKGVLTRSDVNEELKRLRAK